MSTASAQTIQALEQVVKDVGIGTNLGLLHLLWTMVSGAFLSSRGALFGALQHCGFNRQAIQRSWQALRHGAWSIDTLLASWHGYVLGLAVWEAHCYEGYQPVAADVTAFWRPRLSGWPGKFFHRLANQAVKGVGLGVIVQVGSIGSQRIPLLKQLVYETDEQSEQELKHALLRTAAQALGPQEVVIHDGGASIAEMQQARIPRYIVRAALNCTARHNHLPPPSPKGRPAVYGALVRPLPRTWKGRGIAATAPDIETQFEFQGRLIRVQGWRDLVRAEQKVAADQETFMILSFDDPLYDKPLLLATNLLTAQPSTIFALYLDRWPVEQVPLAAKQMLGLQRQFVFAPRSCQRLPQLALLAGNILTVLAAVLPAQPTGFWDRHPKKHRGVYAACWRRPLFPKITRLTTDFGKNVRTLTICRRGLGRTGEKNVSSRHSFAAQLVYCFTTC